MTAPSRHEFDNLKDCAKMVCIQHGIRSKPRIEEFTSWLLERFVTHGPDDHKYIDCRFADWRRHTLGRTAGAKAKRLTYVHTDIEDDEDRYIENLRSCDPRQIEMEEAQNFSSLLSKLPERLRVALWLYFYFGARLTEIASILDVSESRASQLIKEGLSKITPP